MEYGYSILMGFNVTNDVFAKNAWYFRNSLVRANYRDVKNGVNEDMSFLEAFLRNLLMGEQNELKNRYMHIRWDETTHSTGKQHIEQHIQQHIGGENSILELLDTREVSSKMKGNILKLHDAFGMEKVFGRTDVVIWHLRCICIIRCLFIRLIRRTENANVSGEF